MKLNLKIPYLQVKRPIKINKYVCKTGKMFARHVHKKYPRRSYVKVKYK